MNITIQAKVKHILDHIKKKNQFLIEQSLVNNDCLHIEVVQREDGKPYYLKFPLRSTAEEEVKKSYSVKRIIKNNKHIERLVGFDPLEYGTFRGLWLEKAEYSLMNLTEHKIENKEKFTNSEITKIGLHGASALSVLHPYNYIHRDIKKSNFLYYFGDWVLSDLGASAELDERTRIKATRSYITHDEYSSFELLAQKGKSIWYHKPSIDIFQLGVILYEISHLDFLTPYKNSILQRQKFNFDFILNTLNELECSSFNKYLISRLLGIEAPDSKDMPSNKTWEDYRYVDIDTFIIENQTQKKVVLEDKRPEIHPKFLSFKSKVESLQELIEKADNSRESDWNTVRYKPASKVVEAYLEIVDLQKDPGVKNVPEKADLVTPVFEKYELLRNKESELIQKQTSIIKAGRLDEKQKVKNLVKLYEISFIWGPDFTDKDNKRNKGKEKYTYKETINKQTHYHEELMKYV